MVVNLVEVRVHLIHIKLEGSVVRPVGYDLPLIPVIWS